MSMEMAVVTFEGTHTAESELSSLRASRDDAWLTEVAVLEHHRGGRFSMKATTPDYGEKDHVGAGASIGGLTGLMLGTIAGPLGIFFWGTMGAATGGALGDTGRAGAFDPLVDQVKAALPRNSSALILVAETPTAEELIAAVETSGQVSRQQLTDEQVDQLSETAATAR
jgi:uncharacterized membrane protein